MVVVLDTTLLAITKITAGLKADGIAVINTRQPAEELRREFDLNCPLATVDATAIAREVLGVPITNTTMLGALIKATGIVKLESLEEPLKERFGRLAERNIAAMKRAYQETSVEE